MKVPEIKQNKLAEEIYALAGNADSPFLGEFRGRSKPNAVSGTNRKGNEFQFVKVTDSFETLEGVSVQVEHFFRGVSEIKESDLPEFVRGNYYLLSGKSVSRDFDGNVTIEAGGCCFHVIGEAAQVAA